MRAADRLLPRLHIPHMFQVVCSHTLTSKCRLHISTRSRRMYHCMLFSMPLQCSYIHVHAARYRSGACTTRTGAEAGSRPQHGMAGRGTAPSAPSPTAAMRHACKQHLACAHQAVLEWYPRERGGGVTVAAHRLSGTFEPRAWPLAPVRQLSLSPAARRGHPAEGSCLQGAAQRNAPRAHMHMCMDACVRACMTCIALPCQAGQHHRSGHAACCSEAGACTPHRTARRSQQAGCARRGGGRGINPPQVQTHRRGRSWWRW